MLKKKLIIGDIQSNNFSLNIRENEVKRGVTIKSLKLTLLKTSKASSKPTSAKC